MINTKNAFSLAHMFLYSCKYSCCIRVHNQQSMSQETAQVTINAMEKTIKYRLIKRLIMQQKIQVQQCTSKDHLFMT